MKIGDEVFVHGFVDEIRVDQVIINNRGGYFGTLPDELRTIVQCKDCKHAYKRKPINKTAVLCELFGAGMKDNDFCSYGERRY